MKKFSVVVLCMLFFVGMSFAASSSKKSNSSSKIGLGYAKTAVDAGIPNRGAIGLDSIAARIWFSQDLGLDVSLGFNTGDNQTAVLVGGKIIGNFITVNKLNIYWLAGIAFGSYDPKIDGVDSVTIFRIQGGVGAEYYILPCLSVLTEMGLRFTSFSGGGNSTNEFGVFADWLPQAGIRFYFN